MHPPLDSLLNTPEIEIWPAYLLHARGNPRARVLSTARRVLRRKHDGIFVVAQSSHGWIPLLRRWREEPGIQSALDALTSAPASTRKRLPMTALRQQLWRLGLNADAYAAHTGLTAQPEPIRLKLAGFDRYQRPLWLTAKTACAWARMRAAARNEGIVLEAISAYRSHAYQMGIFRRKLARGLTLAQILAVNAAPGFSEHHSGMALDIGTPGEPPLEESFEATAAFAWLGVHAGRFGFNLSYPRGNPHGIVYEPWHWRYQPQV